MVTCKTCGREFEERERLDQHFSDKHAKQKVQPSATKQSSKKTAYILISIIGILILGYFIFFHNGNESNPIIQSGNETTINLDEVPRRPIHWHPKLTIILNGEKQVIPANLGGRAGAHLPIHTHDTSGELHLENNRPTPETVTLGYFFDKILRRPFNQNCIYDKCNGPEGVVTLTVNGKQNFKYDKYVMKDKDSIVIEFSKDASVPAYKNSSNDSLQQENEVKEFSITARQQVFIPNTITVNQGDRVQLTIKSTDISHGIALPDFGIDEFLRHGQSTHLEFTADKAGKFSFFRLSAVHDIAA